MKYFYSKMAFSAAYSKWCDEDSSEYAYSHINRREIKSNSAIIIYRSFSNLISKEYSD